MAIALALAPALIALSVTPVGASAASGGTKRAGTCSRAAARAVIHEHPHLDPWFPLSERPGQVLCGQFLGGDSTAMAVSFAAATCGGTSGWAVFRRHAGRWNLAWHYRNGQRSIAKAGTEIEETLNILKPSDPRCLPTGGTRARRWRWNGSRFVPGEWTYHYLNPEAFLSPDRHVSCYIGEGDDNAEASCYAFAQQGSGPQHAAHLSARGAVDLCAVARPSLSEVCFQNWNPELPVLEYGQQSEADGVRCTSAPDGITCIGVSGVGKGRGFRISKDEAVEVGG
jgi:hypothetical protein